MAETHYDEWFAANYNRLWPHVLEPDILDAAVDVLAALAERGPALEFGAGTGRIALPLARRGIRVDGIELSEAMVAALRAQGGDDEIAVVRTRHDGPVASRPARLGG